MLLFLQQGDALPPIVRVTASLENRFLHPIVHTKQNELLRHGAPHVGLVWFHTLEIVILAKHV